MDKQRYEAFKFFCEALKTPEERQDILAHHLSDCYTGLFKTSDTVRIYQDWQDVIWEMIFVMAWENGQEWMSFLVMADQHDGGYKFIQTATTWDHLRNALCWWGVTEMFSRIEHGDPYGPDGESPANIDGEEEGEEF